MAKCPVTNFDDQSTYDKFMDGGLGYGSICFPAALPKILIMIIFPPLAVFLEQYKRGFPRVDKIVLNFVLTACFYFPGLLHALSELEMGGISCSSITGQDNKNSEQCNS